MCVNLEMLSKEGKLLSQKDFIVGGALLIKKTLIKYAFIALRITGVMAKKESGSFKQQACFVLAWTSVHFHSPTLHSPVSSMPFF